MIRSKFMLSVVAAGLFSACALAAGKPPVTIKFADGDAEYYTEYDSETEVLSFYTNMSCTAEYKILPPTMLYTDAERKTPFDFASDPAGETLYALPENYNPDSTDVAVFTVVNEKAQTLDAYEYIGWTNVYYQCTNDIVKHTSECVFTFRGITFKKDDFFHMDTWPSYTLFTRDLSEFKGENRWTSNQFSFVECDFTDLPSENNSGFGITRESDGFVAPGISLMFKDCKLACGPLQDCSRAFSGSTIDLTMDGCTINGYPGSDGSGWGDVLVTNCVYRNLSYWNTAYTRTMYGRIYYNGHVRVGNHPAYNSYGEPDRKLVTDCVVLDGVRPCSTIVSFQNSGNVEVGTIWMDEQKTRPFVLQYVINDEPADTNIVLTVSDKGCAYNDPNDSMRLVLYASTIYSLVTLSYEDSSTKVCYAVPGMTNLWNGYTGTVEMVPWPAEVYTDKELTVPYDPTTPIPLQTTEEGLTLYVKEVIENQGGAKYIDETAESPLPTVQFGNNPTDPTLLALVTQPVLKDGVDFKNWVDKSNEFNKFRLITGTNVLLFTEANVKAVVGGGTVEGLSVMTNMAEFVADDFLKVEIEKKSDEDRRFYRFWVAE